MEYISATGLCTIVVYALTRIGFFASVLYSRFRDVYHIWEVFVQLVFWITPIIPPAAIVPAKFHKIMFANPMARIIQGSRDAIITSSRLRTFSSHVIIIGAIGILFVFGTMFFK